jgi:hypothetical protein
MLQSVLSASTKIFYAEDGDIAFKACHGGVLDIFTVRPEFLCIFVLCTNSQARHL